MHYKQSTLTTFSYGENGALDLKETYKPDRKRRRSVCATCCPLTDDIACF